MGALDKLLKELEKAKQAALAKGLRPMQAIAPVSAAVGAAVEPLTEPVNHDDAPASNPRSLVINAVRVYHEGLKKLPRQLLEARYAKDVGEPCPPAPREWLIEKMARKYQTEQYTIYEGEVPASVAKYNRIFAMQKPRMQADEDDDDDEPGKDERKFDPTMKAKALIGNPFARGFAYELFAIVEAQANGIQYNGLVLLLKTINDRDQAWAERKAQKVFTKWVDKGWVELL